MIIGVNEHKLGYGNKLTYNKLINIHSLHYKQQSRI